uniref:Dynein light chain roadblock n=1 Tax=Panagrolaimus sp. JU765 TaxID=591449 RepID=A0AC34QEI3_9BILA
MDVDETLQRISSQKGVTGVIIMDSMGRAIRSTLVEEETNKHAALIRQLTDKSKSVVKELDATDDLNFLRLKTKKCELMIVPDKEYLVAVVYEKPA